MKNNVAMLSSPGVPENTSWKLEFAFREPFYFTGPKKYITGMNIKVSLLPNPPEAADVSKDFLLQVELGISGIFSVEEGRLTKEIENELIKIQAPALLFPYIRSTLTSLLSNAGFGSFILPLMNIQEMAKQSTATADIKIVDQ